MGRIFGSTCVDRRRTSTRDLETNFAARLGLVGCDEGTESRRGVRCRGDVNRTKERSDRYCRNKGDSAESKRRKGGIESLNERSKLLAVQASFGGAEHGAPIAFDANNSILIHKAWVPETAKVKYQKSDEKVRIEAEQDQFVLFKWRK